MSAVLAALYGGALLAGVISEGGRRSVILAIRSLWVHKLRLALSVLGIIIGTAAVISLTAFGEGSMQDALDDIRREGATNILVRSVKPPENSTTERRTRVACYGLTFADYDSFQTIDAVIREVPMRIFPHEIRRLDRMVAGRAVATTPEYADAYQLELASGRFLSAEDGHYMRNVVVLGSAVAGRLFPFEDPRGKTIRLGHYFYRVVGVVRERTIAGASVGQVAEDFNNDAYIPLQTCKVRFGERTVLRQSGVFTLEQVELSQITLTVSEMDQVRPAGEVVRSLLRGRHPKDDWSVTVPLDRLEEAERARDRFTRLLVLIASVSLLVGGIGIMNIMLATVTERTREVGIRRALGAKRRDITLQFLVEAVVQTNVGGFAGVIIGLALVYLLPLAAYHVAGIYLPARPDLFSVFLSLSVAVAVGIVFGLYPARRAAHLDPIEALRQV